MELGIIYQTAWVKQGDKVVNVAYAVSERGTMECLDLQSMEIFETDHSMITERPVFDEAE